MPPGATEIARTADASQAFVLDRTLALQFHPELDLPLLEGWLPGEEDELAAVGTTPEELRLRTEQFVGSAAVRIRGLVRGFLTHVARQPCPSW